MRQLFLIAGCLVLSFTGYSQSGTLLPNVMVVPGIDNVDNISNPIAGMLTYHTIEKKFYTYDGTSWVAIESAGVNFPLSVNQNENGTLLSIINTAPYGFNANGIVGGVVGQGTGIWGFVNSENPTQNTFGIEGSNASTNPLGAGVYGVHAGTGAGVWGESNLGTGVRAFSVDGTGLNTVSSNGIALVANSAQNIGADISSYQREGLKVFSEDSTGIVTSSTYSTGLKASSTEGDAAHFTSSKYAIKSNGNIAFNGGIMQPATGRFLKSLDSEGNAQWNNLIPVNESSGSTLQSFSIINSYPNNDQAKAITGNVASEGIGIQGTAQSISPATTTIGVYGENKSTNLAGYGVRGYHAGSGVGVHGSVQNGGKGVMGVANHASGHAGYFSSTNGVAGYFQSGNGYGLQSSGKLRLGGGDTSPAQGKVLMASNSDGDATWQNINQNPEIGFKAKLNEKSFNNNSTFKVFQYSFEDFEDGGNIFDTALGKFTAPATGIYQIEFAMSWQTANPASTTIDLRKNFSNSIENKVFTNTAANERLKLSTIVKLQAGDYIEPVVIQNSSSSLTTNALVETEGFTVIRIY